MSLDAIWESSVPCSQEAGPCWGLLLFSVHSTVLLKQMPCCCLIQLDACLQGVKFALNSAQVPAVSKLDHDTLHLVWTEAKLQQQLDVLDHRWEMLVFRNLSLQFACSTCVFWFFKRTSLQVVFYRLHTKSLRLHIPANDTSLAYFINIEVQHKITYFWLLNMIYLVSTQ